MTLPVRARFRGGRAAMIAAPGAERRPAGPDKSLIKAIARAHRWKTMLMASEVASIEDLAAILEQAQP